MAWNSEPKLPKLRPNLTLQEWTKGDSKWATYKGYIGMTNKYILMYHIWNSFSPELYAAATATGFDEDDGDLTEKQVLAYGRD